MMHHLRKIEISHKTIIFTVFFLIFIWLLFQIREIILLLFVSIIFSSALSPIVNRMERIKIPRGIAIFILYIILFGFIIGSLVSLIPTVVSQVSALLKYFPEFINGFAKNGLFKTIDFQWKDYSGELAKLPANIIKIIVSTFSNIVKIFAFAVINYYFLMERKNLKKHLKVIFSNKEEEDIEGLIDKFEKKLGGWVRGELFLMLIIGLMSYIGLRLLSINFALPLAIIAGLLELIPNIGPTVAAVPAALIGFSYSPTMGFAVIALYFLIQQLENNFIVPKVMQKAVGLHPLVTIIALMIGFKLGGVGGAVLAIPVLLTFKIIFEEFYSSHFRFSDFKKNLGSQ